MKKLFTFLFFTFLIIKAYAQPCYHPADTLNARICMGDSIFANGNWLSIPGTYSDTIQNPNDCDSVKVTILDVIQPSMNFQTITICQGDSIEIFGNWEKVMGLYDQTFASHLGCDSTVLVLLMVSPNPIITFSGDIDLCPGAPGMLTAQSFGSSFRWATGETSSTIYITSGGTYTVTATNLLGCSATSSVFVTEVPAENPVISQQGFTLSSTPAFMYQWYLNFVEIQGATGQQHQAVADGLYLAKATSMYKCEEYSNVIEVIGTSVKENKALSKAHIYPNPAREGFFIDNAGGFHKFEIMDFSGRIVREGEIHNENIFIRQGLFPGLHLVRLITSEGGTQTSTILIQ
jgi:hypothetical protein